MSQVPVELIVAAFQDENGADAALQKLKEAKKENLIAIQNAAVIRRDKNDKLHISETADWGGGKGAAVGAIVGGAIGLIFPPSILVSGAIGAGIGGLAAKLRDSGFPDGELKEIGAGLKPGTSAIVAVVELTYVAEIQRQLAAEGAKTMRQAIAADIAAQLEQGRDVAYTAATDGDTTNMSRTAVGKDYAEQENLAVTAGAVAASKVVVDKDDVKAAGIVATQDEAVVMAMEGKLKPTEAPQVEAPKAEEAPAAPASDAPASDAPPASTPAS